MATKNIQLKSGGGDLLMPKTKAEVVTFDRTTSIYDGKDVSTVIEESSDNYLIKHTLQSTEIMGVSGLKLDADGIWASSSGAYSIFIPVLPNTVCLMAIGTGRFYTFLKNMCIATNAAANISDGATIRTETTSEITKVNIPADAQYIHIVSNTTIKKDIGSFTNIIEQKKFISESFESNVVWKKISNSKIDQFTGYYIQGSTNKWISSAANVGAFIPVSPGKKYRLKLDSESYIERVFAWLTDNTIIANSTPSYANSSNGRATYGSGMDIIEIAPSNAAYLYIGSTKPIINVYEAIETSTLMSDISNAEEDGLIKDEAYFYLNASSFGKSSGTKIFSCSERGWYKVVVNTSEKTIFGQNTAKCLGIRVYTDELICGYDYYRTDYPKPAAETKIINNPFSKKITINVLLEVGQEIYLTDRLKGGCNYKIYKSASLISEEDKFIQSDIPSYPNLLHGTRYRSISGVSGKFMSQGGQGCAIYNGYMFRLYDGGYCTVYDIRNDTPLEISNFKLGNSSHCNAAQFSTEMAGDFPYLYVTGDDYSYQCHVEEVGLYGSNLKQTITFDFDDNALHSILLGDDGKLYVSESIDADTYRYYIFDCPPVSDEDITIDHTTFITYYDLTIPTGITGQGMIAHGGKIFKLLSALGKTPYIAVKDTFSGENLILDLSSIAGTSHELEDMAVWNDTLYIVMYNDDLMYALKFN